MDGSATLALKWSHSIITEEDFLSEWGARNNARYLSLEVQLNTVPSCLPLNRPMRSSTSQPRPSRSVRHVGFDDQVSVVWIPRVPIFEEYIIQCRVPTYTTVEDLVRDQTPTLPGGPPPVGEPAAVNPLPVFAEQILAGDRTADNDDWDQGLAIRTWFLHHEHLPHCVQPRLLQMVGVATSWRSQVLALWLDLIRHQIYLVDPDPPRPGALAHVAYDLLVVQGQHDLRAAGLVTAMLMDEPFQYFAAAALFPFHVSGLELVEAVQMTTLCQQNTCRAFHRDQEIPIIATPSYLVENGRSFAVRLRLTSTSASSHLQPQEAFPLQVHIPAPPVLHVPGDDISEDDDDPVSEEMSEVYSPSGACWCG